MGSKCSWCRAYDEKRVLIVHRTMHSRAGCVFCRGAEVERYEVVVQKISSGSLLRTVGVYSDLGLALDALRLEVVTNLSEGESAAVMTGDNSALERVTYGDGYAEFIAAKARNPELTLEEFEASAD